MTPDRLDRFARHIVLPEVGAMGQAKLAQSHVVLIGMGGIGSPALQYLAGAGIGRLTLVDDDVVEASNLQRQTIYSEADIGKAKAEAAAAWVRAFDAALEVSARVLRINRENAADLVAGADVVLDAVWRGWV
ncbi:MAG: ThiF family adenylyltransferase, partial [Novosphingobium sp.]